MPTQEALQQLKDWFIARALPLWARAGVDPAGGFYEQLDYNGEALPGRRRVRVQCRQIYTFTEAAQRGWLPEGEPIAARGFDRLIATAVPNDAARGCVHALHDDGGVDQHLRDLYDQAFLLLACAARIGAAGDERAATIAKNTLAFLDREFASPYGGFRENDRGGHPRRQNPHMHLFEALMALHHATGDSNYLDRAHAMEALFRAKFFDAKAGALREFFNDDWTLIDRVSDTVEPGHMAEWVALLDRYERLTGETRTAAKKALYAGAEARRIPGEAFLPNMAAIHARAAPAARRLWPQVELLRAAVILREDTDARLIAEALFKTYLAVETSGLWCDEFDAAGQPIAGAVPASILYHIFETVCAIADARQDSAA
ncbi:MAG: AGE family epimerase/isomerase [Parvularculaceae bacterium]|nr:AGE family epimerase/isomerase [Parvularculaceae bacterium]